MKRKYKSIFLILGIILVLTACGIENADKSTESEQVKNNDTITGLYLIDDFTGYKFSDDGIVIYYEANWYKKKGEPLGCKPEFWYGTYKLDGAALTITISGIDIPVTGVVTEDKVIIDGVECEIKTDSYYQEGDHESWKEIDEVLGLE